MQDGDAGRSKKRSRRRRRLVRVVMAPVVVLLVVLTLVVLFRNELARKALPVVLGPELGVDLEIDALSISLGGTIELSGIRVANPQDSSPLRAGRCEHARIELSLGKLASGLDSVESIVVAASELVIDLERTASRTSSTPEGASGIRWPLALPKTTIDVSTLTLLRGDASIRLSPLELRTSPNASGSSARCRFESSWRLGDRRGSGPLTLSFDYASGRFDRIRVTAGEARIVEDGTVDVADLDRPSADLALGIAGGQGSISLGTPVSGHSTVSATFEDVSLEELGELAKPFVDVDTPFHGRVRLEVAAEVARDDPASSNGSVDLEVGAASIAGVPIDRLELAATYDAGRIRVNDLRASVASLWISSGHIVGDATQASAPAFLGSIDGALLVRSADLATTLAPFHLDGDLAAELAGARLETRLVVSGTRISAESLRIDSPCFTTGFTEASCDLDLDEPFESLVAFEGGLLVPDLAAFAELLPLDGAKLGGALHGELSADGSIRDLAADVSVTGDGVSALGIRSAGLTMQSRVQGSTVSIEEFRLTATDPPLELHASGGCDLEAETLNDVTVTVTESALGEALAGLPGGAARYLSDGIVDATVRLDGALSWPDVEVDVRAEGLAETGAGRFELSLRKSRDAIRASLNLAVDEAFGMNAVVDGTVDQELRALEVDVSQFGISEAGRRWTLATPTRIGFERAALALRIDPPLRLESDRGHITAGIEEEVAPDGVSWVVAKVDVELGDRRTIPLPTPLAVGVRCLRAAARYRPKRLPSAALDIADAAVQISLEDLEIHSTDSDTAAVLRDVDLNAQLGSDDGRPRATAAVELRDVEILGLATRARAEPLRGALSVAAAWDGRRVTLTRGDLSLAALAARVSGNVELESTTTRLLDPPASLGHLELRVAGSISELTALRDLVPDLRRLSGSVSFDGTARGDPLDPDVRLDVGLRNGEARFGDAPALVSVDADLTITDQRVDLSGLTGELGGAPLTLTGSLSELWGERIVDLALNSENILLVRNPNMRLRADTALSITGPLNSLRVGGRVAVTDGRLYQSVPLVEFLGTVTRRVRGLASDQLPRRGVAADQRSAGLQVFALRDPVLDGITFAVEVTAKTPIDVRGNVVAGKVRPDVTLRGTGETPFLVGTIYLDDCYFTLPVSRISVESGSVRFDENDPLFPSINLTGLTRIRGYDVTIVVTGTTADPTVTFSSSPPLPADRLVALVTTGADPGGNTTDEQALFAVAKYFGIDLLKKIWGHDIDASESIFDRFELDVGRNVSRQGQETWEARFRIARDLLGMRDALYLTGEQDEFDHYNVGLRVVFRGR